MSRRGHLALAEASSALRQAATSLASNSSETTVTTRFEETRRSSDEGSLRSFCFSQAVQIVIHNVATLERQEVSTKFDQRVIAEKGLVCTPAKCPYKPRSLHGRFRGSDLRRGDIGSGWYDRC